LCGAKSLTSFDARGLRSLQKTGGVFLNVSSLKNLVVPSAAILKSNPAVIQFLISQLESFTTVFRPIDNKEMVCFSVKDVGRRDPQDTFLKNHEDFNRIAYLGMPVTKFTNQVKSVKDILTFMDKELEKWTENLQNNIVVMLDKNFNEIPLQAPLQEQEESKDSFS